MIPEMVNKQELLDYYGYSGRFALLKLNIRLFQSWILHFLAWVSPCNRLTIIFQRARGVKIGKNIILCGVSIGENSILGAGSLLKKNIGSFEIYCGIPAKLLKKMDPILQ